MQLCQYQNLNDHIVRSTTFHKLRFSFRDSHNYKLIQLYFRSGHKNATLRPKLVLAKYVYFTIESLI